MPNPLRAIANFFKRDWERGKERSRRQRESRKAKMTKKWDDRRHRCTRCWYDMRGSVGEVCPECGTPKSRGESIWTDGRWNLRVGVYLVLGVTVAVLLARALFVLIATWGFSVVAELVFSNQLSSQAIDNYHRFVFGFVYLSIALEPLLMLVTVPTGIYLAVRHTTRRRHQEIRGLIPTCMFALGFLIAQLFLELRIPDFTFY